MSSFKSSPGSHDASQARKFSTLSSQYKNPQINLPLPIHFYSYIPKYLCSFSHLEVSKMTMDENKNNGRYETHNTILLKLK